MCSRPPATQTETQARYGSTRVEGALGATWQIKPNLGVYGEVSHIWASGGARNAQVKGGANASVGLKIGW